MERSTLHIGDRSPQKLVARRYDVERSCIRCHERKVRCDRAMPCSTCRRTNAPCHYPGPGRIKRRSKRSSTRRARTHPETLKRTSTASSHKDSPIITSRSSSILSQPHDVNTHTPFLTGAHTAPTEGLLVEDGTSTQYANEFLFSRVLEKVGGLQDLFFSKKLNLPLL